MSQEQFAKWNEVFNERYEALRDEPDLDSEDAAQMAAEDADKQVYQIEEHVQ